MRVCLLWLLLLAGPALAAQERDRGPAAAGSALVGDGDAVFLVGNSFLAWDGRRLDEWLVALGKASSPPVRLSVDADIRLGNEALGDFLEHRATRQALASRRYKVFVLQGEEYEPVDRKAQFHRAVRSFHRSVTAAGGKTALFMTWEFPWRRFLDQLAASYDEIGAELGIPVIPVGLIYRDAAAHAPPKQSAFWLTASVQHPRGDLHPNEKGAAVNTYATFALLTAIDPRGTGFRAPGNSNDAATLRLLSALAWERVRTRLSSPVTR